MIDIKLKQKRRWFGLAGVFLFLFLPPGAVSAARPEYVPGEILVKFKPQAEQAGAQALSLKGRTRHHARGGFHKLKMDNPSDFESLLKAFRKDKNVAWA
jgi:hypothetical protein